MAGGERIILYGFVFIDQRGKPIKLARVCDLVKGHAVRAHALLRGGLIFTAAEPEAVDVRLVGVVGEVKILLYATDLAPRFLRAGRRLSRVVADQLADRAILKFRVGLSLNLFRHRVGAMISNGIADVKRVIVIAIFQGALIAARNTAYVPPLGDDHTRKMAILHRS